MPEAPDPREPDCDEVQRGLKEAIRRCRSLLRHLKDQLQLRKREEPERERGED